MSKSSWRKQLRDAITMQPTELLMGLDDGEVGAAKPAFNVGVEADFIPCGLPLHIGLFGYYLKYCALAKLIAGRFGI